MEEAVHDRLRALRRGASQPQRAGRGVQQSFSAFVFGPIFRKVTLKFSDLDLHRSIQAGIDQLGFSEVTPIQEMTVPHVLEGRDVAGLAQTGTGKTAAFLIPLMERIVWARENPEQLAEEEKAKRDKRAFPDWRSNQFILILVPTRELAEQVYENVQKLKGDSGLRAVSIYGGVAYDRQKEGLRNGVEFVIATPGRLLDLYKENLVDLKQVRAIVFDEADRMFDMGFKDDMKYILQRVPKERQFLVFSATLNLDVLNTAYQFGANPVEVNVSRDQAKAENVDDKLFHVGQEEKGVYLLSLLRRHKPRQAIVFSNFKMNVPRLTQFLNENGLPAVGISSLLTQSQRNRVMEQFKGESDLNILVATDVAARGLDIKGVDMVVNFELPDDPENYVHRIGRTGRAGANGLAFSLVSDRDVDALSRIEQYLKHKVDSDWLEETEMVKDYKAMPSDRGSRFNGARGPGRGLRDGRSDRSGERRGRGGGRGGRDEEPRDRMRGEGRSGSGSGSGSENRSWPRAEGVNRSEEGREPRRAVGARDQRRDQGGRRPEGQKQTAQSQRQSPSRRDRNRRGQEQEQPPRRGANGQAQGQQDSRGSHVARGPQSQSQRRHHGRRPEEQQRPKMQKMQQGPPPRTLGAKVSGFFKRLFGG